MYIRGHPKLAFVLKKYKGHSKLRDRSSKAMPHGQIRFISQNCLADFAYYAERRSNTCRTISVFSQKHDQLQDASGQRRQNTTFFDMPIYITTNNTGTKTRMAKLRGHEKLIRTVTCVLFIDLKTEI